MKVILGNYTAKILSAAHLTSDENGSLGFDKKNNKQNKIKNRKTCFTKILVDKLEMFSCKGQGWFLVAYISSFVVAY